MELNRLEEGGLVRRRGRMCEMRGASASTNQK